MSNLTVNPVKKAASIVICRNSTKLNSLYNYEVLMLQRKNSMKSFGSMLAFPGGKYDKQFDQQLAQTAGISNPLIATALRQCFEETGIYLTKKPFIQTSKITELNQLKLQYIASQFYKNSLNSPKSSKSQAQLVKFYKRIVQIADPKQTLLPFIRLITIPIIKSRFDTYFYIHKLQQFKVINFMKYAQNQKYLHDHQKIVVNQQSASYAWYNPLQVLRGFINKTIKLAPPQFIMLNIMSVYHKYDQLLYFLTQCSQNQINMAPNIMSMINNTGNKKQTYPYAATLISDFEFPYSFCLKNQKNEYLINQINQYKQKAERAQILNKNRLLFKKPLQFFQEDYQNQCTIQDSVMSKFMDFKKLKTHLEMYQ